MTGTEPAAELAFVTERNTAQMRADPDHDEPLGLLDPRRIRLGIGKDIERRLFRGLYLLGRATPHEHRLSAPFDGDDLPRRDAREIDFRRRQGERRSIRIYLGDKGPNRSPTATVASAPLRRTGCPAAPDAVAFRRSTRLLFHVTHSRCLLSLTLRCGSAYSCFPARNPSCPLRLDGLAVCRR